MKRESGENPEQTRCCELHLKGVEHSATVRIGWEGLDDRSKSEDLPCVFVNDFRGKKFMSINTTRAYCFYIKLVTVVLLGTTASGVWCATPDSITVRALEEVTVNGKAASGDEKASNFRQTLDEAALKTTHALLVSDAVAHFSGALIRDYGGLGGMKTVSVRGMGAHHTAVSYDGVTLTDCQTGQIDLSRYSLENIDLIELTLGEGVDIFQPARLNASSSLLSLHTRQPVFAQGKRMNLKAGLKTGSFGLLNPDVLVQMMLSSMLSVSVSGEYMDSKGDYPFKLYGGDANKVYETVTRLNNASDGVRGETTLYGAFPRDGRFEVKAYWYTSSKGLPGAVILYNPYSSQHLWDNTGFLQAHAEQAVSSRWRWQLNAKYLSAAQRYLNPDYLGSSGKEDQRYQQEETYVSGVLLRVLPSGFAVSMATDASLNRMSSNLYQFSNPLRLTLLGQLSASYASAALNGSVNLLGTFVNEETLQMEPASDRWKASPSFSLAWKPSNVLPIRLRTFYKSSFRMPSFNDLYYSAVGNRNLRPENSRQLNVGVTLATMPLLDGLNVRMTVDGYHNRITDKILAVPTKNIFVWSMVNLGDVRIHGVDVTTEVEGLLRKDIQWKLAWNHSYQRALDMTDPTSSEYGNQIAYAPRIYGSGRLGLKTPWVDAAWSVVYSGHRYVSGHNLVENDLPGYADQSVSLERLFHLNRCALTLKVEALNLAGSNYELVRNFPMPGRSFRCGISVAL